MKTIFLSLLLLLVSACKKTDIAGQKTPAPFVFALLDKQGTNLLTSTTTPIQVYSINSAGQKLYLGSECAGGGCTMVRQAYIYPNKPVKYPFDYQTSTIPSASLGNGTKTWYVEMSGKTDTLFYDMQYTTDPNIPFEVKAVTFNGRPVTIDPDQLPVYPLQRQH